MIFRFRKPTFPHQEPFTLDDVRAMTSLRPRRSQLNVEWPDRFRPPNDEHTDWSLTLPFKETFWNLVLASKLRCEGPQLWGKRLCGAWILEDPDESEAFDLLKMTLDAIGDHIVNRDRLAMSASLDFTYHGQQVERTKLGKSVRSAKIYSGERRAVFDKTAADVVSQEMLFFLEKINCFADVDVVCAVPSSDPAKSFHLPSYLGSKLAESLGIRDAVDAVTTDQRRKEAKELPAENKLEAVAASTVVAASKIRGKRVLLIDDLYESGISMNVSGHKLLEAGAKSVFGLSALKTLRNDDNVSH